MDRNMIHSSQAPDNERVRASFRQMVTPSNTYAVTMGSSSIIISQPYDFREEKNLDDLVRTLRKDFPVVVFEGLFESTIPDNTKLNGGKVDRDYIVYQQPLTQRQYSVKLRKFDRADFHHRMLTKEDIPQIEALADQWFVEAETRLTEGKPPSRERKKELEHLGKKKASFNAAETFNEPLSAFYGAIRKGELLAFTQTMGNHNFQSFIFRASRRINGTSPQEFLDYQVCRELVSRGVKLFQRGETTHPQKTTLETYKEKFGEISLVPRISIVDAHLSRRR